MRKTTELPSPRVALAACSSYGPGLRERLQALLSHLGGMAAFVRRGDAVLIKPNLLTDRTPDRAVTTHPELVRALIRLVRDAGGVPCVADSPNSVVKLERVWDRTGFRRMCDEEDAPLLNLEKAGSVAVELDGFRFSIAKPVLEADVVINVPKVKTHVLTTLTAAVKNMYGAVPGYQKTQLHRDYPNPSAFGRLLAAVYRSAPPHLSVADAVVGMQGDGPSAGEPLAMGFIAASPNGVALDRALCHMLGVSPAAVPYIPPLENLDPGPRLTLLGADMRSLAPAHFRTPNTLAARLIPSGLVRMIGPLFWIRPSFSDRCIACGRCAEACPVDALELTRLQPPSPESPSRENPPPGSGKPPRPKPRLDPSLCIGCCCCHEVCPANAVTMVPSPLLRIMRRGKPL